MAAFNSQFAGKEAFTADNGDGYLCSHLAGRTMRAHRVIWAIVHGRWQARIVAHGKRRSLGVFDTQEEARDAYLRASKKYHGEYGWRS